LWERGSRTCKYVKCFTSDKTTYNVTFFFDFHWDGCKSSPRIALERASPWHLSIVTAKTRMMEIYSIEIVKLWFEFNEYIPFQYWANANYVRQKFKIQTLVMAKQFYENYFR
jgi:hypothetical protein